MVYSLTSQGRTHHRHDDHCKSDVVMHIGVSDREMSAAIEEDRQLLVVTEKEVDEDVKRVSDKHME